MIIPTEGFFGISAATGGLAGTIFLFFSSLSAFPCASNSDNARHSISLNNLFDLCADHIWPLTQSSCVGVDQIHSDVSGPILVEFKVSTCILCNQSQTGIWFSCAHVKALNLKFTLYLIPSSFINVT